MQWKDIARHWSAYTPQILTRWPELDETDVLAIDGDQDAFINYLARKKGGDRVAAQMAIADWLYQAEPADVIMDESRDNERISASAQNIAEGEDPLSDDAKFGAENAPAQPLREAS